MTETERASYEALVRRLEREGRVRVAVDAEGVGTPEIVSNELHEVLAVLKELGAARREGPPPPPPGSAVLRQGWAEFDKLLEELERQFPAKSEDSNASEARP